MEHEDRPLKLRKIRLVNWKSFKDCIIELNDGLNVLVGPNASGKTNLLEAFKFLKKALVEQSTPYAPHLEWWSPKNLVYGNDTTKPITFELYFTNNKWAKELTYNVSFTLAGENIQIYSESIKLDKVEIISRRASEVSITQEKDKTQTIHPLRFDYSVLNLRPVIEDYSEILNGIKTFLERILYLRHINVSRVREPAPVIGVRDLAEDGSNVVQFLHSYFISNRRYPDSVESALATLFPDFSLKLNLTQDGRVFMAVDDLKVKAVLQPPCIPDGLYKVLHLMTALASDFSILCVDEVENSLHFEALEYVVHEFKESGRQILVATHSPIVVDVAGLETLLLFDRTLEGSVVKKIENVEELRRWMREKGLTPSEVWEYGLS